MTKTLITGADRGMGYELALELGLKGQYIYVGSRNLARGQAAVTQLEAAGVQAQAVQLDVTDHESIVAAKTRINANLDILINNAGIAVDHETKPSELSLDAIRQDFNVNYFGLIDVTQVFLPLLKTAPAGRIINVSSAVGSLTLASDANTSIHSLQASGYQASKAAVNMFTVKLAAELEGTSVTVNAVNPGWVDTSFGGGGGNRTVQVGVARTVALASADVLTDSGTFSDIDGIVPW
ncbi:SDR family NAD(P)-dependent oxidoreductase [Levilactobacillus yiduensis]|uniref:SDR family NAD(P)-dependent oxidoreductase n=1 Tax=Levilactobacillus yiduensis TaxID=2953880 RepID=UPI000EF31345|nr:SDR family NAD(P)-dependent oxidoreductase [Levilactobacillus yiduensis]AYM01502.1 SDR family NAD(P)-dependent oxidoreductase [Levilactobacillus brevis]